MPRATEYASYQTLTVVVVLMLVSLYKSVAAEADIPTDSYDRNRDPDSTQYVTNPIQCHIQAHNNESLLTCQFPMDIRLAKKNFNVQAFRPGSDVHELAVGCLWRTTLQCVGKPGLVLRHEDKTNVTFHVPLNESQSMIFSCHLTPDIYKSANCSLPAGGHNPNLILNEIIGLLVGIVCIILTVVAVVIAIKVVWNKRKKKRKETKNNACEDVGDQTKHFDDDIKTGDEVVNVEGNNKSEDKRKYHLLQETVITPIEMADQHVQESNVYNDQEKTPLLKENNKNLGDNADNTQEPSPLDTNGFDNNGIASQTLGGSDRKEVVTREHDAATQTSQPEPNYASVQRRKSALVLQSNKSSVCEVEYEKRKQWTYKGRKFLQRCQQLTNDTDEKEVDQYLKKCRELTFEIRFNMELHKTLGSANSLDEYSSESDDLRGLLIDADKMIVILESFQKGLLLKKLTERKVGTEGNKTRLQAIEDFINGARQLANEIENHTDGITADISEHNLKRLLELELECNLNKLRMEGSLDHCTSNSRQHYENMLISLEGLQDHLVDCRATVLIRSKEILQCSVFQRMNQEKNDQTENSQILQKGISTQELEENVLHLKKDEDLDELLPTYEKECIIIPAQHKSHVYAKTKLIGYKNVDILIPTGDQSHCNINDLDNVHEKIHAAFSKITEEIAPQEVMVLMTQTNLDKYNKLVPNIPVDRKCTSTLERIRKTKENHSDIMIINKQRGILGGIVQSVHLTDPVTVGKILADSMSRLTEATHFIEEWLKTVPKADNVAVRMTLILPNINRKQFHEQIVNAVQSVVCLCKEEDTVEGLKDWWEACWTVGRGHSVTMDSSLYRNLLNKFAVPAIRLQKYLAEETNSRSEKEAQNSKDDDCGSIFSHWSLLSSVEKLVDFDCLDETQDDIKFFWGSSGTGKTILLQLRALQWASHFGARQIFILQTTEDGTAAACLMEHQLQAEVDVECTFTHLDLSKLWKRKHHQATNKVSTVELTEEEKKMLCMTMGLQQNNHAGTAIHVVADEADGEVVAAVYKFLKAKSAAVFRFWAAGAKEFQKSDILPVSLRHAACHVTEPLVCPKPATGGARRSEEGRQRTEGSPLVELLCHTRARGGHTPSAYPWRCEQCSKDIVDKLKSHLVGATGGEPQGLSANDVFVLGSELSCDIPEDDEFSPAPLIRILQINGYNVSTLSTASARDHVMSVIRKTVRPPSVTVANEKYVWGLQRNVIVYCESGSAADMDSKLRAICTTTSILIDIKSE